MQLVKERRLLNVLYETGKTLEVLVRDVLGEPEAVVVEPPNSTAEDGTLENPGGQRVVFEVKGRRGSIKIADARQLSDWVNAKTYVDEESEPEVWKGLLIANPFHNVRLAEREDEPFGANCIRFAQREGLALVTTTQLISALRARQLDEFSPDDWWHQIVETSGVVPGWHRRFDSFEDDDA